MLSETEFVDKVILSAYTFHIATGEIPNTAYISKNMLHYAKLNGYPTFHMYLPVNLILDDRSVLSDMQDISLTVKTHKNEAGYDALYTVYVTRET
jgi:hypothetical protein